MRKVNLAQTCRLVRPYHSQLSVFILWGLTSSLCVWALSFHVAESGSIFLLGYRDFISFFLQCPLKMSPHACTKDRGRTPGNVLSKPYFVQVNFWLRNHTMQLRVYNSSSNRKKILEYDRNMFFRSDLGLQTKWCDVIHQPSSKVVVLMMQWTCI